MMTLGEAFLMLASVLTIVGLPLAAWVDSRQGTR